MNVIESNDSSERESLPSIRPRSIAATATLCAVHVELSWISTGEHLGFHSN